MTAERSRGGQTRGGFLDERRLAGTRRGEHVQHQQAVRPEEPAVPLRQPIVVAQDRLVHLDGLRMGMRVRVVMTVVMRVGMAMLGLIMAMAVGMLVTVIVGGPVGMAMRVMMREILLVRVDGLIHLILPGRMFVRV